VTACLLARRQRPPECRDLLRLVADHAREASPSRRGRRHVLVDVNPADRRQLHDLDASIDSKEDGIAVVATGSP
jgi:hypothetical protein